MDWKLAVMRARRNGASHRTSHWYWDISWGIPIGHTKSSAFSFDLRSQGGIPWGIPGGSCHSVPWPKILCAGCLTEGDDLGGSSHHVLTQFFMHLKFETYQNSSKRSQMNSNKFVHSQKSSKLYQLAETSTFVIFDETFQTQSLRLSESS